MDKTDEILMVLRGIDEKLSKIGEYLAKMARPPLSVDAISKDRPSKGVIGGFRYTPSSMQLICARGDCQERPTVFIGSRPYCSAHAEEFRGR